MSGIQFSAPDEIIVDSFAGGGGTSTGIELATGRVCKLSTTYCTTLWGHIQEGNNARRRVSGLYGIVT